MSGTKKKSREEFDFLLRGIAHEIRNPLNALTINTQVLLEYADLLPDWFEKKKEMIEILQSNVRVLSRLNDVVSEFLRFSRLPRPEFAMSDLDGIVSEVISFVEGEFRKRGIRLRVSLSGDLPPVLADEKLVKQALLNLLLNAADALDKEEKEVSVETGVKGESVFAAVSDNGVGISRDDRKKIFTVFYTTKREGSGLGLPLVKKIMDLHGGKVEVRSRRGKGSRFSLVFPPARQFEKHLRERERERHLPEVVR
ncbi:MAG: sensor histidine kinase [Deltaproteobacteria bacterium]|nr:MAG: sensor histidine kinase [Deltaproteobacteria bacterium]